MFMRYWILLFVALAIKSANADPLLESTKTKDSPFALALVDGIVPAQPGDYAAVKIPRAKLYDLKAGKPVGNAVLLDGKIDLKNEILNKEEGWFAIWHPSHEFLVLGAPEITTKEQSENGIRPKRYLYFQIDADGLHRIELPDLTQFIARQDTAADGIHVNTVVPHEWVQPSLCDDRRLLLRGFRSALCQSQSVAGIPPGWECNRRRPV